MQTDFFLRQGSEINVWIKKWIIDFDPTFLYYIVFSIDPLVLFYILHELQKLSLSGSVKLPDIIPFIFSYSPFHFDYSLQHSQYAFG